MRAATDITLKTVLIPKDNEKDLAEIPENVKKGLEIVPLGTVDEVLEHALIARLVPIEWSGDEDAAQAVAKSEVEGDVGGGVIKH